MDPLGHFNVSWIGCFLLFFFKLKKMQLICSRGPVLTMWQEWRMVNSFVWLSVSLASFPGPAKLSVACIQYTVFSESKILYVRCVVSWWSDKNCQEYTLVSFPDPQYCTMGLGMRL